MYEKIIQSGNLIEVYTYEKEPIPVKRTPRLRPKPVDAFPRARALRNINRAKVQFRRMVRSSLALGIPSFVTLTMADVSDLGAAYKAFSLFGTRMRKSYGNEVAWIAVPEYQERGALHFHALIWGLPKEVVYHESPYETYLGRRRGRALVNFIDFCYKNGFTPSEALGTRDLQSLWRRGWCDISPTDGSPKLASYLAKYMLKTMRDNRSGARKGYLASRNALRPMRTTLRTQIAFIKEQILKPHRRKVKRIGVDKYSLQREITYDTKWLGRCHYQQFAKEIIV